MKKILAIFVSVLLLFSLFGCGKKTVEGQKSFTLVVVHADGSEKEFSYTTNEEYLGAVLQAEGIIQGSEGPYGMMIEVVDGEKAVYETDGAYWALYEGEEYAMQGIDKTPITDGGVYKLVYEKG